MTASILGLSVCVCVVCVCVCVCVVVFSFPLLLSQRFAGTRFEEQRQLHMPQKHKATEQDSTLQVEMNNRRHGRLFR